jgi:hypothetical protein
VIATCVSLSSGETFYVDAHIDDVVALLGDANLYRLAAIGGRYVNPLQVAQITVEPMSTIHTPEKLEAENGVSSN